MDSARNPVFLSHSQRPPFSSERRATATALSRKSTRREDVTFSGLGSVAIHTAQWFRTRTPLDASRFKVERQLDFGVCADTLWHETSGMYLLSAVRDATYLRCIYPQDAPPFHGLRITNSGETAGWAQVLDCKPKQSSYFGAMKVMALIDGVAPESTVAPLVAAALRIARENGADLVISNQMHQAWTGALRDNGFWQGPSNYLLALSNKLAALLEPLAECTPLIHFNRGDGDGIVNLLNET